MTLMPLIYGAYIACQLATTTVRIPIKQKCVCVCYCLPLEQNARMDLCCPLADKQNSRRNSRVPFSTEIFTYIARSLRCAMTGKIRDWHFPIYIGKKARQRRVTSH